MARRTTRRRRSTSRARSSYRAAPARRTYRSRARSTSRGRSRTGGSSRTVRIVIDHINQGGAAVNPDTGVMVQPVQAKRARF